MSRRIFFDASLIGVALALEQHDERIVYPGHPEWPYPQDAPDEEWLRYVGAKEWCAILRDKRIRYRPTERAVLESYKVRVVAIATRRNLTIEQNAVLLKRFWGDIEAALMGPPSFRHLTHSGLITKVEYETPF